MAKFNDYVWLFPFIGSILVAIGLFTPVAIYHIAGYTELYWMHGLVILPGGMDGPEVQFVDIPGLLIPGIISLMLLTIFTVTMFVSALTHRGKETPGSWIALGILLIGTAIYFIAGTAVGFAINRMIELDITEWVGFWENRTPGFAVIAPFIGGGLAILGAILGKTIGKQEGLAKPKAVPQVEETIHVAETPVPSPIPVSEESMVVRYCPECGTKIEQLGTAYCAVCGYKF
ncbi:MAG: zinc ribbon domain-containing protein [Candidatus Hodarchaeota archaeon]